MKRSIKNDNLISAVNQQKIDELCKSIRENCESHLGWEQLTKQSGFSHTELIALFQLYKQTTPMAYIKSAKQTKKNHSSVNSQSQPLPDFIKRSNDESENLSS